MEIITIKKKTVTWPSRLKALEVGEELKVSLFNAQAVRGCISRTLKLYHPEMEFTTETKKSDKGKKYLEVKRVA